MFIKYLPWKAMLSAGSITTARQTVSHPLSSQPNRVETVREMTLENDVSTNTKIAPINNFFRATDF